MTSEWKHVRSEQHSAFPELSFALEINPITLEFRMRIQGQTFIGRDSAEVLKQAGAYLQSLSAPGTWRPMIELARHSQEMQASRWYIRIEENGVIVRHPWVDSPEEIKLARITELRYHSIGFASESRKVPPCMHNDGFSSYYHLPYTTAAWERTQALADTCNRFFARISTFLKAASVPHAEWEMHFLEMWRQHSFFEVESNEAGGRSR